MKKSIIALLLIFLPTLAVAQGARFIVELNDIPVLDGLVRLKDRGYYFESPSFRLADIYFRSSLDQSLIETFYQNKMPSLGWKNISVLTFSRGPEKLTILFEPSEDVEKSPLVRFILSPSTPTSQKE